VSRIVRRSTALPSISVCGECGRDVPDEFGERWCYDCDVRLPWRGEVGRIDAVVETEGGGVWWVRGERHEHGGWFPSEARPADPDDRSWPFPPGA
jgi:hypothetical protein